MESWGICTPGFEGCRSFWGCPILGPLCIGFKSLGVLALGFYGYSARGLRGGAVGL